MIRVLHIFYSMANGGTEKFVMNYYRHIDRTKIQFDFLTSVDEPGFYDDEIISLGGRLFHAYPMKKNPFRCYSDISKIVRENKYIIVHRHTGSAFGYFELRAAKHGGAKHLILHAHNPMAEHPTVHVLANLFLQIDCIRFACSQQAGEFLFGKTAPFTIIKNAIDSERFAFSEAKRMEIREKLHLGSSLVLGHIGRMEEQKNHHKLLQIFDSILRLHPDSFLMCVGEGSLMDEVKKTAEELMIKERVLFLGNRTDVPDLLNAFDAFCLPSHYEGFGITLIEAQANGLKCFASKDVIPESANVSGNVCFIPLSECGDHWASQILGSDLSRDLEAAESIKREGYDISSAADQLAGTYCGLEITGGAL